MKRLATVLAFFVLGGCGSSSDGDSLSDSASSIGATTSSNGDSGPLQLEDVKNAMSAEQREMGEPEANSVGMIMVPIRLGQFEMGPHDVVLSKPYYISATEVTQRQWQAVMGTAPWSAAKGPFETGDSYPASYISWQKAADFCEELSKVEGAKYRLPTNAEWEYACRAGSTSDYSCEEQKLDMYAWLNYSGRVVNGVPDKVYLENGRNAFPHPVATKLPNPWGLYDMHGNVSEWCNDWVGTYEDEKLMDPVGPAEGDKKYIRGGNAQTHPKYAKSSSREGMAPADGEYFKFGGFRVVREAN